MTTINILIQEDNPVDVGLVHLTLAEAGFTFTATAWSGRFVITCIFKLFIPGFSF
jgi:hypothetical protein